jgi:hypothetical protein
MLVFLLQLKGALVNKKKVKKVESKHRITNLFMSSNKNSPLLQKGELKPPRFLGVLVVE